MIVVHRHHSNNSNPTTVCRGAAIYCASKGAVSNMVRAVATEVAADGVRVNAGAASWLPCTTCCSASQFSVVIEA